MRILQIVFCLLGAELLVSGAFGQGDLATDRPSESAAATLVPLGYMRAEVGGQMNWFTEPDGNPGFSYAIPQGVIRYGLHERIELRLGARFAQVIGDVEQAMLGAKIHLPGSFWKKWDAAWLAELAINPAGGWSTGQRVPMSHRLCFGRPLGDLSSFSANAGWSMDNGISSWMSSMVLARELGRQGWVGFVEPYFFSGESLRLNLGFQREVAEDMLLDFVYGRHFESGDLQIGLGLSFTLSQSQEDP